MIESKFQLITGIVILLFSATNIFVQIQLAFNEIYAVRAKAGVGIVKQLLDRLVSLGIILSLGFLLVISLTLDSVLFSLYDYLSSVLNEAAVVIAAAAQYLLLGALVVALFFPCSIFYLMSRCPNTIK